MLATIGTALGTQKTIGAVDISWIRELTYLDAIISDKE